MGGKSRPIECIRYTLYGQFAANGCGSSMTPSMSCYTSTLQGACEGVQVYIVLFILLSVRHPAGMYINKESGVEGVRVRVSPY